MATCDHGLYQYQQSAKESNAQCRNDRILCEANEDILTNEPNKWQ